MSIVLHDPCGSQPAGTGCAQPPDAQAGSVPTPAIRNFRHLTTDDLVSECEYLKWVRLDVKDQGGDTSYLDAALHPMVAEIDRRRSQIVKYKHDPLCPQWPDVNDTRYQDLLATARDLKAIWPIEKFLTVVVGVDLKRSGRNTHMGRCPIHDDKTPSLVAYANDDHVHCFGCGFHGDIFSITGAYFRIDSFTHQVQKVKEATGDIVESSRIIVANEREMRRACEEVLA
jgi:hypothetical protein